ncbi:MAG: XisI protein [Cyanobacteriota bacterium]|nr:XisI protein [Cyanobacteriota bacterium]
MDTLERDRQTIIKILQDYARLKYRYGEVERIAIFDRETDNYLLVIQGWEDKKRVHGCLIHLQILDGKIWIQRDGIEHGIANDLVAVGIPKERIVLAFHREDIRPHTEFAVR